MFKTLFLASLLITLVVNIIFLLATKDKPPDVAGQPSEANQARPERRLFLRSNDFYDYSATATSSVRSLSEALVSPLINESDSQRYHYNVDPTQESARAGLPETSKPDATNGSASSLVPEPAPGNKVIYQDYGDGRRRDQAIERPPATRYLNIRLKSSRNHVFVSANNIVIHESKPSKQADSAEGRGLHVLVLNQFHGSLMAARVFDTYLPGQDDELAHFLGLVSDGRILVLAVKDEASFKLGAAARGLLRELGSQLIEQLRWRDMWALVARKQLALHTGRQLGQSDEDQLGAQVRRSKLAEALAKSTGFADWAQPVELDIKLELLDERLDPAGACKWMSAGSDDDQRRRAFCNRVEGYERVCDCDFPAPISFNPMKMDPRTWQLARVPIVVMASNRPYYLYRMLRSLLSAHGINGSMVNVFIDGFYDEPLAVSRLFNVRAHQRRPLGTRSGRISHHYRSSLSAAFELHPQAEFLLIFEEDLDVASDALVYFNQTLPVLRADPSLYCVSAWNDQGYEHTALDPKLVYRVETMPGLGWLLERTLYKRELEPNWPPASQPHDWDMWIRTEQVRRGRECLIPDISRTYHFGSTGTNINSYFQHQYFSKHAFNRLAPVDQLSGLGELAREPYERSLEHQLKLGQVFGSDLSRPVNVSSLLCSLADRERPSQMDYQASNASTVIYIEMIDDRDFANWLRLAKCWRIWDLDARGQHRSMWRLFVAGRPTLVVGVPASPYSRFMPAHLSPIRLDP